jgi:hypothetical protein
MDITDIIKPKPVKSTAPNSFIAPIVKALTRTGADFNREAAATQKQADAAALKKQALAMKQAEAARIAAGKSEQKRQQQVAANPSVTDKGTTYKPSSSGTSTASSAASSAASSEPAATDTGAATEPADPMASIYGPLEQIIKNNKLALENRYGQNAADIKSITGVLTAIAPADKASINQQFTQSIEEQQKRTAEAIAGTRLENAAGVQGASAAAGELGSGDMPVPTSSATGTAQQQQIDNAAQGQSNWSNFMTAMQNQQVGNAEAAQRGYGFEIANALQQLSRQKNAELGTIGNQELDLASQKAQSQLSAQQASAKLAQDMAVEQMKANATLGAAQIRAGATQNAAGIRAAASRYAADVRAAASGSAGKLTTVRDWEKSVRQQGLAGADLTNIKRDIKDIESRIVARRSTTTATGTKKPGKATADDVYSTWIAEHGDASPAIKDAVALAIKKGFYKSF